MSRPEELGSGSVEYHAERPLIHFGLSEMPKPVEVSE